MSLNNSNYYEQSDSENDSEKGIGDETRRSRPDQSDIGSNHGKIPSLVSNILYEIWQKFECQERHSERRMKCPNCGFRCIVVWDFTEHII